MWSVCDNINMREKNNYIDISADVYMLKDCHWFLRCCYLTLMIKKCY